MKQAPSHVLRNGYFLLLFDLSRGKQALLSVSQPVLGAILALGQVPDARTMVLGLVAAVTGYFAVFSLNDVLDYKIDREALKVGKAEVADGDIDVAFLRHPLARGALSYPISFTWVLSLALISGFLAYLLNPLCLLLFIGCVALEVIYCSLRAISWLKTIVSGMMVGLGGLAGWAAVSPLNIESIYFFTFLALWEIAGRNLANDLADVDSDSRVGLKTVATIFGNNVSSIAILIGSYLTITTVLILPIAMPAKILGLAIGMWSMGIPAIALARMSSSIQAASYFNKASLFPMLILVSFLPFLALGSL